MVKFNVFAIAGCALLTLLHLAYAEFYIDYEQNTFVLNGKPYRYVAGSVHYFRMPREYWRDRLRKLRAAGLNAVSTYVEWSSHERVPGVYNFEGDLNIAEFIKIAQEEDLQVILRPGPYICAEREMGGFPYWLLKFHPDINLRSSDPNYLNYVERWINVLFKELEPLWHGNGGPIILVQVENEYGNYGCDHDYIYWLANLFQQLIQNKAVLFTTDNAKEYALNCAKAPGAYATVDFAPGVNVTNAFAIQRQVEPKGPLVTSEFYPGWMTHWGEKMAHTETSKILKTLREVLDVGANVNFYMFYGGTNFGFTAGADTYTSGANTYTANIQSYDYDSPISEAGDLTDKYWEIRKVVGEYLTLPNIDVETAPKGDYGEITLQATASLFSTKIRGTQGKFTTKDWPTSFESVGQNFGYLLYETSLPATSDQWLWIEKFSDLAHVYLNEKPIGNLSREFKTDSIQLPDTVQNDKINIVVENLGRINVGPQNKDPKGILSNVTLDGKILKSWDLTSFEFDNVNGVEECFTENRERNQGKSEECLDWNGFIFYATKFQINEGSNNGKKAVPLDTYLNVSNLSKGFVFINGVNIGRYWPARGPQYTMYIPGVYLKSYPDENTIVVMDEEIRENEIKLSFTTSPIFTRNVLK